MLISYFLNFNLYTVRGRTRSGVRVTNRLVHDALTVRLLVYHAFVIWSQSGFRFPKNSTWQRGRDVLKRQSILCFCRSLERFPRDHTSSNRVVVPLRLSCACDVALWREDFLQVHVRRRAREASVVRLHGGCIHRRFRISAGSKIDWNRNSKRYT